MDYKNWLVSFGDSHQLVTLSNLNEYSKKFGLVLTQEESALLLRERTEVLKQQQRVEFGDGILPKLIVAFCDSPYLYQDNYVDTLGRLQEIFYYYKNEFMDEITDDELIEQMKMLYDGIGQGSLDYMEETGLEGLARRSRFGHGQYEEEVECGDGDEDGY